MSDPKPIDPMDPMAFLNQAIANAHAKNELLAAEARVRQLESRLEALRDAGDKLWYCYRHADLITAEDIKEAIEGWREARNDG